MLKTFPRRKQIFVPQAVCKTVVPESFSVLLSQRRRWINSTVHNLMELVLVRDLCGTFCLSMQVLPQSHILRALWLIAVCRVYRTGWDVRITSSHRVHSLRYCHCGCQTTRPHHPARPPRSHSRAAGSFDRVDGKAMVVRWLDAHLSLFPDHLELCPSRIRILEL